MRRFLCLCHAIALATLLALAGAARGHDVDGRVVTVHDGDTVTIVDGGRVQRRVRIAGIDAPEKAQPFGAAAKENLARLVHGRHVAARCHKRDRFGREVCSVFLRGRDVGLEQVQDGLSWWYRDYAREQLPEARARYEAAEIEAKGARRGLWRDATPQAPWMWRKQQTSSGRQPSA